eukprot:7001257-Prymnesium_polylepis.1
MKLAPLSRRAASALLAAACLHAPSRRASAVPTTASAWESWVYDNTVEQAVVDVRALLVRSPEAKILSQSPDRRYMRVSFDSYDLVGRASIDDCQFYMVPTGDLSLIHI